MYVSAAMLPSKKTGKEQTNNCNNSQINYYMTEPITSQDVLVFVTANQWKAASTNYQALIGRVWQFRQRILIYVGVPQYQVSVGIL